MEAVSNITAQIAKKRTEGFFRNPDSNFPTNAIVMRLVRSLWPSKTDMHLAAKTKASDRMCRYWLENKYSLSADHLAALLRSDEGFQILESVIGDAKPVWWRAFKRSVRRAELRRKQVELAKQIEDNEQSELNL